MDSSSTVNFNVQMRFTFIGISNFESLDFSICFVGRFVGGTLLAQIFIHTLCSCVLFCLCMFGDVHCACFNSTHYISKCVAIYLWLAFNGICSSVYCFPTKFKDQKKNRPNPPRCTSINVSIGRSFLWGRRIEWNGFFLLLLENMIPLSCHSC